MKLLRVIVFDGSDARVFDRAAHADEWAVSGAFAFAHHDAGDIAGKERQAFVNGFLGVPSLGRSTFVSIGEATPADHLALVDALARHFMDDWGAPGRETARAAAHAEVAFAADLARDLAVNTLLAVRRSFDEDGHIREEFRIIGTPAELAAEGMDEGAGTLAPVSPAAGGTSR